MYIYIYILYTYLNHLLYILFLPTIYGKNSSLSPLFTRSLPTSNVFLAAVGTAGLLRAPSASNTSLNAELNDQRSSDLRGKPLRIRVLRMARCSVLLEPLVQWEMDPHTKIRLFSFKLGSF